MLDITVIILTRDEDVHIERAIRSAQRLSARIIVVDSFSTDRTCEIARSLGARVYQHEFTNQAKQFAWALKTGIETEWVLKLDADEIIGSDLVAELHEVLPRLPPNVTGLDMRLKWVFMDRSIRFGGRYPIYLLRLFRFRHGRIEDKWMDEHIVLTDGVCAHCKGHLLDRNLRGISYFVSKHNRYATREAVDVLLKRIPGRASTAETKLSPQAAAKRFLKERVYNKAPVLLAPFLYFSYRMIIRLGVLDGRTGIIYHELQGLWYRFIVAAKLLELENSLERNATAEQQLFQIERLTGCKVN